MMMKVSEIAKLLGVSYLTAWGMVSSGKIRAYRVGGAWRVPAEALNEYLAGRSNQNKPDKTREEVENGKTN